MKDVVGHIEERIAARRFNINAIKGLQGDNVRFINAYSHVIAHDEDVIVELNRILEVIREVGDALA